MRIVLVAEEAAGLRVLQEIVSRGHELAAVLCGAHDAGGRPARIAQEAEHLGVKARPAATVHDPAFRDELLRDGVDVLLNVHSLVVLPAALLSVPRYGCFNLHPGPLPRYAGLNAVSWAIYNGEREYGVTLHAMTESIDAGDIVSQEFFEIGARDNALAVYAKCLQRGLPLIKKLLDDLAAAPAALQTTPQDASRRHYVRSGPPNGGWVDWSVSARQVWNLVKACDFHPFSSPWGAPRCALGERAFGIAAAEPANPLCDAPHGEVGEVSTNGALVACGDAWLLVKRLLADGRRAPASEFLRAGQRLTGEPRKAGP